MDEQTQPAAPSQAEDPGAGSLPGVPWTFLDAAGAFVASILLMGLVSPLLLAVLDDELARGIFFPVSLGLLGLSAVGWVALRHRSALPALPGHRPTLGDAGAGVAHGVAAFLVINVGYAFVLQLVATLTGGEMPVVQEGLRDAAQDGRIGLLVIASALLVAPVAEELFFRGVLFRGLLGPLGRWPAIGLSALLFGVAHYESGNPLGSLYAFVVLASLGGYLAWAFARRGTILTPILMHATFNALAVGGILLAG